MKRLYYILAALLLLVATSCGRSNKAPIEPPHSMEQLKGCKIAVINGSVQDIALDKLGYGNDLVRLATASDIIAAVSSGTADYMVIDSCFVIGSHIEDKGIVPIFTSEPSGPFGYGVRKDESELRNQLDEFLQQIRSNGTYDKLYNRWFKGDVEGNELRQFSYKKNGKPLIIGASTTYPFVFMKENEWSGFEIEMVEMFAQNYGYVPKIVVADFSALIPALVSGKMDILAGQMTITEERKKSIDFTEPYYISLSGCFAKQSRFQGGTDSQKTDSPGYAQSIKNSFTSNFLVEDRWKLVLEGLWETIVISFFSIIFGALLGCVVCALMFSRRKAVRKTTNAFCTFICGIPILVLLMVMFYIVFASSTLSGRVVAIIAFSINFACSISSVYYSGIKSVDPGQREAGLALGFTPVQTFLNFILPQASKQILPLFKGEASSLIKNTSVVGYIAILDLTKVCDIIRSRTFDAFFPLIAISIVYFLLAWGFGAAIDSLGKKLK